MFVPSGITLPFHQRTFTESPHNDYEMRTTINDWLEMTFTHVVTHTTRHGAFKTSVIVLLQASIM